MHTHALRCVFPGCKFSGGPDQKDIDRHVREKHGTTNVYDPETFLAEASNKTLPAVKPHAPHATNQLDHEEIEYIPSEYDSSGEAKISPAGELLGGRSFLIRTFVLPHRSEKRLMVAAECALVLRYRDSYLLFNKNRSLLKIIATQEDKDFLIQQEIIPYSYRSRQIALISAKSIFRQFGARVIIGGRHVRDDYWEARAVKDGYTEEDMPEHGKSRSAKTVGVAGQAGHLQEGAAQLFADIPRQLFTVNEGVANASKASILFPGNLSTRVAETESLLRNSGALPSDNQGMVDLFREQQPSPSKEEGDSSVLEATLSPTFGDFPSSSTTKSLTQQSSSHETLIPRQYENSGQHKDVIPFTGTLGVKVRDSALLAMHSYALPVDGIDSIDLRLGRVDALGPPSQDYPKVILLSLHSIEQYFPSICFFYYALRSQSLKL